MKKPPRSDFDADQLRVVAEQTAASLQPPAHADSDQLRQWHELQVSQIELDMQQQALAQLQRERDAAEEMRERYALLYDQAPAGYLSVNADGAIIRANLAASELLHCRRTALIGKRFEQFVAPQAQAGLRRFLERLFAGGAREVMEAPLFDAGSADGTSASRRVRIEANFDAGAGKCRMILTDIGSPGLRESERQRALQVLDSLREGVLVCDARQQIVSVNAAFTEITGYPVEEALGRNPRFLGRQQAHAPGYHAEAMHQLRAAGKWQGDVYNRRRDGTPYTAHFSMTVMRGEDGAISHFIGVFSDVTAQRQAEAELRQLSRELDARVAQRTAELTTSRAQLERLAAHLEHVKEQERQRLARDLHDELGQNLLALRIDLSMLSGRTGARHPRLHQRVNAALENVDLSIRSVRGIMNELRPAVLDLGLQAAFEWQVDEFRKRSGLDCELTLPDEAALASVPAAISLALFRSLQEALSNVRRHAQASRVEVGLALEPGRLWLSVSDDGVGLGPAPRGASDSFGLIGMAQRVAALGGHLDIGSPAGRGGCRLTLSFDL
ncbi:PAS domain-containing sensor histidine kinase [Duganella callida]|uniref:histidine kinase n=1 Tax=Duganella callida TaxID=2561932 RepID=A0A4Y9SEX9_9BURK|nr:PAS domain-containing protein [Duganella callida]TFW18488.1 PAS domain-containing protein [Duganella callida]